MKTSNGMTEEDNIFFDTDNMIGQNLGTVNAVINALGVY